MHEDEFEMCIYMCVWVCVRDAFQTALIGGAPYTHLD